MKMRKLIESYERNLFEMKCHCCGGEGCPACDPKDKDNLMMEGICKEAYESACNLTSSKCTNEMVGQYMTEYGQKMYEMHCK